MKYSSTIKYLLEDVDMYPYKRIFVIVADSAGIGYEPDADKFFNAGHTDVGTNTFVHIAEKMPNGLNIPNMNKVAIFIKILNIKKMNLKIVILKKDIMEE